VELGKQIADATYIALQSGDSGKFDASTEALLQRIRNAGRGEA
jgi:hypothetical protein